MKKAHVQTGTIKGIVIGLAIGIVTAACSTVKFPYKYYKPDVMEHMLPNGAIDYVELKNLLGATPSEDLPASTCAPTATRDTDCVVMRSSEFFKLKLEHIDLQNKLSDCQSGVTH